MVALHPYLSEQTTFEPPAIEAMSRAFEEASPALKIPSSKSHEREVIAMQGPDSSCSWVGAGVVGFCPVGVVGRTGGVCTGGRLCAARLVANSNGRVTCGSFRRRVVPDIRVIIGTFNYRTARTRTFGPAASPPPATAARG